MKFSRGGSGNGFFLNKYKWLNYRRRRLTPIDIPRFPFWEIIAYGGIILYGLQGLFGFSSQIQKELLGSYDFLWSLSLLLGGILIVVGMFLPLPNALIIQIVGCIAVGTACAAVQLGISVAQGNFFYRGSAFLLIYALGSITKIIQSHSQLNNIKNLMIRARLSRNKDEND